MSKDRLTSWQPKRILITGSGGFIGQHLVRTLRSRGTRPFEIRGRNDCDLCDYAAAKARVQQITPDVIVHLAASADGGHDISRNHSGLQNTVCCALNILYAVPPTRDCLFVHAGSYKQYGNNPLPFREHVAPSPVNLYGLAKQSAENLVRIRESNRFRAVYLRIGAVYGPGQPQSTFVDRAIRVALEDRVGDFKASDLLWDPVYVGDVVNAICHTIDTPSAWGQTINISGGVPLTPLQVFRRIVLLTHGHSESIECEVESDGYLPSLGEIRLARELLGWEPKVDLSEGLKFTIEEYRKHSENRLKCTVP